MYLAAIFCSDVTLVTRFKQFVSVCNNLNKNRVILQFARQSNRGRRLLAKQTTS